MKSVDNDAEKAKKPYTAPELVAYGNIRDITKSASNTNPMVDGGSPPSHDKT